MGLQIVFSLYTLTSKHDLDLYSLDQRTWHIPWQGHKPRDWGHSVHQLCSNYFIPNSYESLHNTVSLVTIGCSMCINKTFKS